MTDSISYHNSSGAFLVVLNDSNLFFTSIAHRARILLMPNSRVAGSLPMMFNRILTFAISGRWPDSQSAPGNALTSCTELLQRCWQRK